MITGSIELAKRLRVDRSTLIMACKSLGYDGYRDFRNQLKARLSSFKLLEGPTNLLSEFKKVGKIEDSIISSFTSDISALTLTAEKLDFSNMENISKQIIDADSVYIIGLGYLGPLATYFKSLLKTIRPKVLAITDYHGEVFDTINNLVKNDVIIGFAFDKCMSETFELFQEARKMSIPSIAIIDNKHSKLNKLSSSSIIIHNTTKFFFTPHVAAISICNAIMHCVVEFEKPHSITKLKKYYTMAKKHGVYL